MKTQRHIIAGAALFAIACGTATMEVGLGPSEELGQTEQGLELKVRELFGATARVERIFGRGEKVLVGVALEAAVEESDVPLPLALASLERSAGTLSVVSAAASYKEARLVGESMALLTQEGVLQLRTPEGAERTLATGVKGDLFPAGAGALLFTQEGGTRGSGDSAVMVAAADGNLRMLADAEGVDDRGSVSPDGTTVVFVSGRTGIASLWRTTVDGAEAVQLTNLDLEAGLEREGAPAGFVPPPVTAEALRWVSADLVRFDAGGGESWSVNIRTGVATREGGAQ